MLHRKNGTEDAGLWETHKSRSLKVCEMILYTGNSVGRLIDPEESGRNLGRLIYGLLLLNE